MDHSEVKHLPKVDHTPAELDEPSRLLLKAAALIEKRGHAKGRTQDEHGGLCIYGAIGVAKTGHHEGVLFCDEPAWRRVCDAVGMHDACYWNNATERTQSEVVAKLRAVAFGL